MLSAEQILFSFIDAKREFKTIEQKITMIEQDMLPKSPVITDMPKGHNRIDKMADMMVKLDEIIQQCNKARREMVDKYSYVEHLINLVESPLLRCILTERYIIGKTWEKIAESTEYSLPQVFRLRKQALLEIQKILDDCK